MSPLRARSACGQPGCAYPFADHNHAERATAEAHDQHRGSAASRGYDRAWRRLARQVLREDPWCRHCKAKGKREPATLVDHIVPKPKGSDDRANLQPLCRGCHARKTAAEQRR